MLTSASRARPLTVHDLRGAFRSTRRTRLAFGEFTRSGEATAEVACLGGSGGELRVTLIFLFWAE